MFADFKCICHDVSNFATDKLAQGTDYITKHQDEIKSYLPIAKKVAILVAGAFLFSSYPLLALGFTAAGYVLETNGHISATANKIRNHINLSQLTENEKIVAGISLAALAVVFLPYQLPAAAMGLVLGAKLQDIF